jgi:DNA primase
MLDVASYLEQHGVEIVREEGRELACLCPFHKNTDSPAFYINKDNGLWICFNPACEKRGSLRDLMRFFGDEKPLVRDYDVDQILALLDPTAETSHREDWDSALESIRLNFPDESGKAQYLFERGLSEDTLAYFEIGFSEKRGRVVIPARDEMSRLVGFIGRSIREEVQPKYLYSKGFPRKSVLFNLNRAKKYNEVVVVEGSVDAMKIHESGFPNVVATLGASVTEGHVALLRKYFDKVIIFPDNDDAGKAMRDILLAGLSGVSLGVVRYPDGGAKDPGEMSAELISEAINSAEDGILWMLDNNPAPL